MSVMDKLKQMLKGHEEQAGKGIDKGGDMLDEKTQASTAARSTPPRTSSGSSSAAIRPGPGPAAAVLNPDHVPSRAGRRLSGRPARDCCHAPVRLSRAGTRLHPFEGHNLA